MPDSLLFTSGSSLRRFSLNQFSGAGAVTVAAICKPSTLSGYRWMLCRNAGSAEGAFIGDSAGVLKTYDVGTDPSGPTVTAANEWYLIAVTKAAGTAVPRGHIYRYSTTAWTHSNFAANQNQLTAWTTIRFVDPGFPWLGNILIAAAWDSVLSDATIETLTASKPDWVTAAPDEAWRFDTASAITPFVGSSVQVAAGDETLDVGDAPAGWTDAEAEDTEPPTDPAALTATAVSSALINLGWTASTDNVAVSGYLVERCTGAACVDFAQIATPTVTSYSSGGLTPETLYRYRVRAADAAGNLSGYSGIAEATTEAAATGVYLGDLMNEMADRLLAVVGPAVDETEFQVVGRMNPNPTPPSIDIYPGDPFRDNGTAGFGDVGGELLFTVRARVTTVDNIAGQNLLLRLMDDEDDISVAGTLMEDQTLNGLASSVYVEGNTGYTRYLDGGTESGGLLGCEWRVRVLRVPV